MNNAASTLLNSEKDACGVGFVYRPVKGHQVLSDALTALARMEHRGACGADGVTGDGAGIMTAIPWDLFAAEGITSTLPTACGMVFLPDCDDLAAECIERTEQFFIAEGFSILTWRQVPLDKGALGPLAHETCPRIIQFFVTAPAAWSEQLLDQKLMFARKRAINQLWAQSTPERDCSEFYIASLSTRTIVYKAMTTSQALPAFYLDLQNPAYTTSFAVYHRRFSTNTQPRWRLAQPFRLIGHNGEINTLLGNRNWMTCRETLLWQSHWTKHEGLMPVVSATTSDSGSLDNALELLVSLGRRPESALMQLIPDAHRNNFDYAPHPQIAGFYNYFSGIQEPWDGPALIVYSDGTTVGAKLDRNGMRPARFVKLDDGSVFLSSEVGVVDFDESKVVQKGRLGPGQMLTVEIDGGAVKHDVEIKALMGNQFPYLSWVDAERIDFAPQLFAGEAKYGESELLPLQMAYGYGREDNVQIISAMAASGHEAIYSMGDDTPLAVLSGQPRPLYDYFKQRFAQVTNPPIDHLREPLIMSLDSYLGRQSGWFSPSPQGAKSIHLSTPILNENDIDWLENDPTLAADFACARLSLVYNPSEEKLDDVLNRVCAQAIEAAGDDKAILILSDKGISPSLVALPILMAVGAVHHALIGAGLRLECSIIAESAQVWTTHQFACLFGFGAQAVSPYLAFEIVRHTVTTTTEQSEDAAPLTVHEAQANFVAAVEEGLLKVLSKMGISSLSSYIGAQIFECVGLGDDVVERCFKGTPSRIGGLAMADVERDVLEFHRKAYPFAHKQLFNYGMMSSRPGGEYHGNNPKIVRALHSALGISQKLTERPVTGQNGDNVIDMEERRRQFQEYSALVRDRPPVALRDLLDFDSDRQAIDVSEVESAEEIVKRFCTGGMSLGALSKEAHEVLAIAMNRLGARSNSGEGGEDPLRYYPINDVKPDGTSPSFPGLRGLVPGDRASSAVRQVASARFGVTPEYLVTAEQLEIKIAQGAKPGEGGQLPAHKVTPYIAKLRRARAGMSLISPPPHHDIYSIEDLAQLIFDLRQVHDKAGISVKLVAEIGIGAVACGVAKADADIIQVSGNDGGTGASALSSIKNAGVPWELGLAEVHQSLVANALRNRVQLRVDGGLRSGWEVVVAALLGADEFGFGSIALIAEGCIMARICHTNNCPVGITSQKEKLRAKFTGVPEQIVEFFLYIAEEVRFTLAALGYKSIEEILGHSQLLKLKEAPKAFKVDSLNLQYLLTKAAAPANQHSSGGRVKHHEPTLTDNILAEPEVQYAIENHQAVLKNYPIVNTDRSVGARIGGTLAKRYGDHGFRGKIALRFNGSAGQSFGAFIVDNVKLALVGDANDYVGKGMCGGEISIKFNEATKLEPWQNVIAGNTCLYGATGGALYCCGQAGERFAVRNSGASAVVEGLGDHGCEYMTGGSVVVLGPTGRNFAAGMTGGIAYVLDCENVFEKEKFCGESNKKLQDVNGASEAHLRTLIEAHHKATASLRAENILANWQAYLPLFWQIVPEGESGNALFEQESNEAEPALQAEMA